MAKMFFISDFKGSPWDFFGDLNPSFVFFFPQFHYFFKIMSYGRQRKLTVIQEYPLKYESPRQTRPPMTYAEATKGTPTSPAQEQVPPSTPALRVPTDLGPIPRRSTRQRRPPRRYIAEI